MLQVKGIIGIAAVLLAITLTTNANQLILFRAIYYTLIWSNQGIGTIDQPISIWRHNIGILSGQSFAFGDVVSTSYDQPTGYTLAVFSGAEIASPTGFTEVWNNGAEDSDHVRLFRLNPPAGHVCLGDVAVKGLGNTPDLTRYGCVKSEFTVKDGRFDLLWSHVGSNDVSIVGVKSPTGAQGLNGTNSFIAGKSLSDVFQREARLLKADTTHDLSAGFIRFGER